MRSNMKKNLPQPYWAHVLERFPKDMNLLEAAAGYLEMRIKKNTELSINEWDNCLDEILKVYDIPDPNKSTRIRKISTKNILTIPELTYLFVTATARKWNHIIFTSEQDKSYANIAYYQDPYWQETKNNPVTQRILRGELGEDEQSS